MTVGPLPHLAPVSEGSGRLHGRLARWAVGLSFVCGALIVASMLIIAISAALGAEPAGLGMLLGLAVPGSLVAFVLALVAKARGERWTLLWLPVGVFPAAAFFFVLGEAFLWE